MCVLLTDGSANKSKVLDDLVTENIVYPSLRDSKLYA